MILSFLILRLDRLMVLPAWFQPGAFQWSGADAVSGAPRLE